MEPIEQVNNYNTNNSNSQYGMNYMANQQANFTQQPYVHGVPHPSGTVMTADANGNPVVVVAPVIPVFTREMLEKRIKEKFPKTYAYVHAALVIILGLAGIAFQIVFIVEKGNNYVICNGIWAGVSVICIAIFTIITASKLIYCMYVWCMITNMLSIFFFLFGYVIITIYTLNSRLELRILNYIMMGLGACGFILAIAFSITVNIQVGNRRPRIGMGFNNGFGGYNGYNGYGSGYGGYRAYGRGF